MDVDLWNKLYGHKSRGLGGAVDDGDSRHALHSRLVRECGTWLNTRPGVLVWATATGRFTGKRCFGTPGVPDLAGWAERDVDIAYDTNGYDVGWTTKSMPLPLYVECKIPPDDLTPAQVEFRKLAEAAGVLYYVARWDGVDPDRAADDLKKQWGATKEGDDA